ncbi:MBL fold metallo-hydrolase [Myxococcota bacterium]|nr:MBL fold metallo-hydrolase [Myxococcota bacterium]
MAALGTALHRLFTRAVPRDLLHRGGSDDPSPAGVDEGVVFRFLGTAGFEARAAGESLLVDPYLSRPGLWRTLTAPLVPDPEAVRARVNAAHHVFAGHSHHDHSLDVPEIARQTGARVYGSPTTLHLARAQGAPPDLLHPFRAGDELRAGAFRARVVESCHGLVAFGRVPLPGALHAPPEAPPRLRHYREGGTFGLVFEAAGVTFMHLGSANFLPATLEVPPPDVLMLCIVGRQKVPDFTRRVLEALRPRYLLPCHYDDFALPFDEPMRQLPGVALERFMVEAERARPETKVVLLDFFQEFRVRANR